MCPYISDADPVGRCPYIKPIAEKIFFYTKSDSKLLMLLTAPIVINFPGFALCLLDFHFVDPNC